VEVTGTTVVTEAFPLFEDIFGRGFGEGLKIWKMVHPVFKIGQHGFYLSLLKHELGNYRAVETGFGAPGEGALCGPIPLQENGTKRLRRIR
jgi:hypothetical protein